MLGALVVTQAIDVREVARLRGANIMQRGTRCDGGGGVASQAKAVQRASLQLALEQGNRIIGAEGPGIEAGFGTDGVESCAERFGRKRGKERCLRRQQ